MIYCTNLCTEITQNQSPTQFIEEYVEDEDMIVKNINQEILLFVT